MQNNIITHDITSQFHAAARLIKPGSLVKDDHFSLFEAVGALEIGDAKMDSGFLQPGESLDEEYDVSTEFLPEELIWLMDELLNREVAWLMGYPLSQTLFTSVHVDRLLWPEPKKLSESTFLREQDTDQASFSHRVLRAFCLLLIKSCDLVLCMVTSQHFYEEEDFTTQLFHRELLHRFSAKEISQIAQATLDQVTEANLPSELSDAVTSRLDFRLNVLEMLTQHADGLSPQSSFFPSILNYLASIQESHVLGKCVPDAFSTKLQRRLASTVPPRPMVTVSMPEAWKFWREMIGDCKNVFSVHEAVHSQDLWTAQQILAYTSPQPSTYPRALLQSFLARGALVTERVTLTQFLEEDLQTLTLPASQLLKVQGSTYGKMYFADQRVVECMQNFTDRFEQNFNNLYRALCLNSCRIRRTFCQALLEWDNLQAQVEEIDTIIQDLGHEKPTPFLVGSPPTYSFSLSSWVYHHKLNVLRMTIQMGFGLNIYDPSELATMYWYLSSICDIHLSHLERISHFVTEKDTSLKHSRMDAQTKEKGKTECKLALERLYQEYAWIKATQLLASATHGIFVILQRLDVLSKAGPLYSSELMRHEIRMKPFLGLSIPEPISHEEFQAEVEMDSITTDNLLDQITTTCTKAKKAWEGVSRTHWHFVPKTAQAQGDSILDQRWGEDVKNCLKTTISASLCVVQLRRGLKQEEWKKRLKTEVRLPELGDKGRWHQWWILPDLPAL